MKKIICNILVIMCIITLNTSVFASTYIYPIESEKNVTSKKEEKDASSISTESKAVTPEFNFESQAQILIEPYTLQVLYENNADEHLKPASVTKVMTLLLAMEEIDKGNLKYDDLVTCSENASTMGGSQIWFKPGETLTVDECLKAICVVSANDVTVALAEHIAGTEENFVARMNEKAKELGMNNTCFKNCHGIDEEGRYTCARDIALMSAEILTKHQAITKYTTIWMDTLRNGTFELSNTNKLIKYYDGAIGLKTGFTTDAGYNLSFAAKRNDTMFIAVAMKAPSSQVRNKEVSALMDYAFATYESKKIYSSDYVIEKVKLSKNINDEVNIKIKDDISCLLPKGSKIETENKITYEVDLKAPLEKDTVVGKVEVFEKETSKLIGKSDLYIENEVLKSSYVDYLKAFYKILSNNNC